MKYLVAIHHPDNFDPSTVDKATMHDIHVLNEEMEAAGVRFFAGGLQPEGKAKSLRAKPNGEVIVTDGPYLETKEHVGGFWVLEAASLEEALDPAVFVRIHRSFVVNFERVSRIEPYGKESKVAVLGNGVKLPVSRAGYERLRKLMGEKD